MAKKTIAPDQLRAMIEAEAAKDPVCEDLTRVQIFGTEEGGGTWTAAWHGLGIDRAANAAIVSIISRLCAEYDVTWETRH